MKISFDSSNDKTKEGDEKKSKRAKVDDYDIGNDVSVLFILSSSLLKDTATKNDKGWSKRNNNITK